MFLVIFTNLQNYKWPDHEINLKFTTIKIQYKSTILKGLTRLYTKQYATTYHSKQMSNKKLS